VIDEEG